MLYETNDEPVAENLRLADAERLLTHPHVPHVARQRGKRMTERDWLSLTGPEDLYGELATVVQPRKLFQLGAAFLTRVREHLREPAVLFALDVAVGVGDGPGGVGEGLL